MERSTRRRIAWLYWLAMSLGYMVGAVAGKIPETSRLFWVAGFFLIFHIVLGILTDWKHYSKFVEIDRREKLRRRK